MRRTLGVGVAVVAVALQALAGGLPSREAEREPEPTRASPPRPAPLPVERAPVDPSARLPAGDDAAEHWDLAAHFDSGQRLYARFLVTNAGPGERSAVAFGHWVEADGRAREFRNGRRAGRWQLADGGRRIDIGSSLLLFANGARHFEVDNDKRGIEIRLDFPDDRSGWRGPARADGYRVDLLNLATPARASARFEGMDRPLALQGRVLLTHTWFPGPEPRHLWRRLDVASLDDGPRLFLSQGVPPGGEPWAWGVAGDDGGLQHLDGLALGEADTPGGPYAVPRRLDVKGNGPNSSLHGALALGPTRLAVDPLDALPALLRMVYSFGGRPRHVWVDSRADVVLKSPARDAVLRIEGAGIATFYFLDASPPSQR